MDVKLAGTYGQEMGKTRLHRQRGKFFRRKCASVVLDDPSVDWQGDLDLHCYQRRCEKVKGGAPSA
eukprot:6315264-Alexandrium_andersonii.AAC.1